MTWADIVTQWPELTSQAQRKWSKLSDQDLAHVAGDRDRLVDKLEKRYGLSAEEGKEHVDEWCGFEAKPRQ